MGVDLFFVLSGFLIGGQVFSAIAKGRQFAFGDFYLRRAFRILPAFWAVLLLYVCWPTFREAAGMDALWKFLTFTINFSIDYGLNSSFSHAWSLCVEEHFYLFFPVLAVALMRQTSTWKFTLLCIFVVLGGILLRAMIWTHNMATDPNMIRNWFVEDIYYPTWNRLDGLLCGVALAAWKNFRPPSWLWARRYANFGLLLGVLVMALAFWLFLDRTGLLANTIGWPVLSLGLGLLVFAGADRDSFIGRVHVPSASWLAGISYSLYLIHKPAYHLLQAHWGLQLEGTGFLAFLAYGSAAILAGAALHYAVERPFLKLRWRLGNTTQND